ncbi:CutA-like protein [Cladochytrium replicatum]|nr:CutA-like protein [Cladochytrium replicatum]
MSDAATLNEAHPVTVLCTVPSEEVAKTLARAIVDEKLAACVNIVPKITSVYWWDGKVNEDNELLLVMKTQSSLVGQIKEFMKSNHPYDLPEIKSFKIEGGNRDYIY